MMLDQVSGKLLLPLLDRIRGNLACKYSKEVNVTLRGSLRQVNDFQLARLRKICRHSYKHSIFYRSRFDEIGVNSFDTLELDEFKQIPPLTKSDIREELKHLISDDHSERQLRVSATGGTTSSPTSIRMDWPTLHRRWAATYEWDRRIGFVRGQKAAYLWGASQDFPSNMNWSKRILNSFVNRNYFFSSSPLDDDTMGNHYESLRRLRPRMLQAYPTPLAIFSDFLIRNNRSLKIPVLSVTAEPLLPEQDRIITTAFGRRPFNWYGARETGRIATDCHCHLGMHINTYGVFVEIDSEHDYRDQEVGRILITDLWNYGMPIIRYEIGDLGTITHDICACGSHLPRITRIAGRTTDTFINSSGQRIPGVAFTNRIVKDDAEIREMQFIQTSIGEFEVLVVPGQNWQGDTTSRLIRSKLSEFMQEPTIVKITIVDGIPREASGKVRFCKSLIPSKTPR